MLTDGRSRAVLANQRFRFFAPRALEREVRRHAPSIAKRAGLGRAELDATLTGLFGMVAWVDDEQVTAHWDEADAVLGAIDPDDVAYLAAALAVGAEAIWSHDLDFDAQDMVPRVAWP